MARDDSSIRQLILAAKTKKRKEIEDLVWEDLKPKAQEQLGRAQLRRMIAAELNDPDQLEFTIDGEPYPIEDVPPEMLRRRGYRLVVAGERLIKRGEAYIAEAKARLALESDSDSA